MKQLDKALQQLESVQRVINLISNLSLSIDKNEGIYEIEFVDTSYNNSGGFQPIKMLVFFENCKPIYLLQYIDLDIVLNIASGITTFPHLNYTDHIEIENLNMNLNTFISYYDMDGYDKIECKLLNIDKMKAEMAAYEELDTM